MIKFEVEVIDCEDSWKHNRDYPEYYPKPGTIGTVTRPGYAPKVQWPKGTTSEDDNWWVNGDYLREVKHMGQYYRVAIITEDARIRFVINLSKFITGYKLMEHSYMGNYFVNIVLSAMLRLNTQGHETRVVWMGDYAEDADYVAPCVENGNVSDDYYLDVWNAIWPDDDKRRGEWLTPDQIMPVEFSRCEDYDGWYLVNHTKQVYLDLGKFWRENCWKEEWEGKQCNCAVHPLPLLTACGNGQGGGDYSEGLPDADKVGCWAFDNLEFTESAPENYLEKFFKFTEH